MSKGRTRFVCQECGHESSGWLGRCPGCAAWNTLLEQRSAPARPGRPNWAAADLADGASRPVSLASVTSTDQPRLASGIGELDRVLGGGYVRGSLVLLGGDPGVGKSTLLLQCLAAMSTKNKVLYVSGEESAHQIRLRADRLKLSQQPIDILTATDFAAIAAALVQEKPDLAVIDSIQTVYLPDLTSAPGSVSQIKEATAGLLRLAKELGIIIVLVGHVTKEGALAGPRVLEHMVDTVLYFEGEKQLAYRLIRSVKNRFGATDELGLFEMTDQGLMEISNASMAFLAGRPLQVAGSVITACLEGTRPLLVEVQALVSPAAYASPQRMAHGLDRNRITMLLAVLDKLFSFGLGQLDSYVSVVGGLRLNEPALDLSVVAAVVSSLKNKPVRPSCLVFGEVGLTGEIRAVFQPQRRILEAARQGFTSFILPGSSRAALAKISLPEECDLFFVDKVGEALDLLFAGESR